MNRTDAPRAAQPLRLWRSAGLRLAALFGFLVLLTMLTTLALVYLQVSTVLHRNLGRACQSLLLAAFGGQCCCRHTHSVMRSNQPWPLADYYAIA